VIPPPVSECMSPELEHYCKLCPPTDVYPTLCAGPRGPLLRPFLPSRSRPAATDIGGVVPFPQHEPPGLRGWGTLLTFSRSDHPLNSPTISRTGDTSYPLDRAAPVYGHWAPPIPPTRRPCVRCGWPRISGPTSSGRSVPGALPKPTTRERGKEVAPHKATRGLASASSQPLDTHHSPPVLPTVFSAPPEIPSGGFQS